MPIDLVLERTANVSTALNVFVFAFLTWMLARATRNAPRLQNTYQHIVRQTHDRDLIELFERFRNLKVALDGEFLHFNRDINDLVSNRIEYESGQSPPLRVLDLIVRLLNFYEATAIGIRRGALEEKMIFDWWRTTFVNDWIDVQEWVRGYRLHHHSPKTFCETEELARKWATPDELAKFI